MKPSIRKGVHFLAWTGWCIGSVAQGAMVSSSSDIAPAQKRQHAVESARQLAREPRLRETTTGIHNAFNPPDVFLEPHPRTPAPELPVGDRELLQTLAANLPSAGTMNYLGKPVLTMGRHRIEIGQVFKIPHKGQDYELELVDISPTAFTLRFRNEVFTRALRTGR